MFSSSVGHKHLIERLMEFLLYRRTWHTTAHTKTFCTVDTPLLKSILWLLNWNKRSFLATSGLETTKLTAKKLTIDDDGIGHIRQFELVVSEMCSTCNAGSCEASVRHGDARIVASSFSYTLDYIALVAVCSIYYNQDVIKSRTG